MRILIQFVVILFSLLVISCSKNDSCNDPNAINYDADGNCKYVDTTQRALYIKLTATWCPPCGSSGAIKMKETLKKYENAIGMEVHYNDAMSNNISNGLKNFLKSSALPAFFSNTKRIPIQNALAQNLEAAFSLDWDRNDDAINLTTHVKAIEELKGQYFLAAYLMEDGHVAAQKASNHSAHPEWEYKNGQYPKYIHTNILRGEATNSTFGTEVINGTLPKGDVLQHESKINAPYSPQAQIYPVVVLWKKVNGSYEVVNAISGEK